MWRPERNTIDVRPSVLERQCCPPILERFCRGFNGMGGCVVLAIYFPVAAVWLLLEREKSK